MESEKLKEIKKSLEERTQHKPINCSHSEYVEACGMYCRHRREFVADMGIKNGQICENCNKFTATDEVKEYADILTLINEFESENESLKDSYIVKAYDKLRAKNKKLKETFKKFTGEVKENLKESVNAENVDYYVECVKVIDEILKRYINE